MLSNAGRHVLKAVSVLTAVVVALWAFSYHSFEFKGGMGIHDSGFFSYPRYHAQIGELPLWTSGEYKFAVRGLPPGPLNLELQVPDATYADRAQLTSLSTSVSASIIESSGRELCSVNGNLSDAENRDRDSWVLASSSSSAYFWQSRCQQLPIRRFKTYLIKVTVSGVDGRSPRKMLRPVLLGGGIELP